MKTFLHRVCLFCSYTSICLLLLWLCVIPSRSRIIPSNAHLLFLGTSRIQYSIDDTRIPGSFNWGNNGENYFWTYQKLKLIKKYNSHIDTLLLICDYPSLTFDWEDNSPHRFSPYYFDILSMTDYQHLIQHDINAFRALFNWHQVILSYKAYLPFATIQSVDMGGFVPLERNKLSEDLRIRQENGILCDSSFHVNQEQLVFLDAIVAFCQQHQIEVIFLTPPSYPTKGYLARDRMMDKFIHDQYPNIPHWDDEFMPLPDSCYGDIDHLNSTGASLYTKKLYERLHPTTSN